MSTSRVTGVKIVVLALLAAFAVAAYYYLPKENPSAGVAFTLFVCLLLSFGPRESKLEVVNLELWRQGEVSVSASDDVVVVGATVRLN